MDLPRSLLAAVAWWRPLHPDRSAEFRIGASSVGFVAYMWNPVITEDPHEIAKLVHTHGDLMPEWIVEYLCRASSSECGTVAGPIRS